MIFSSAGQDLLLTAGTILALIVLGTILAIIGIQHEHLTKLRDRKAELEIMIKDLEKKNAELEKELMKYDKKRKRDAKKQDNSN